MRKADSSRSLNPSRTSLDEMPEIEFSAYRIRRNPYAKRVAREGIELRHEGPSAASLAEMPEVDFSRAHIRKNKFAAKALKAATKVRSGRGRPPKGMEVGPTPARSIRLPDVVWKDLEIEARERSTTVHALVRKLIVGHVSSRHGKSVSS